MQQQKVISGRRSTKPNATSKRHGRSSSGSPNGSPRSMRQSSMTRDDDDGRQANRRSKKDNVGRSGPSGRPASRRQNPVGGGRASKNRSQGSTRRAKQVTSNNNRGRNTPKSPKGSSAKSAASRRR